MSTYNFKITKTYHYYGTPQIKEKYRIENEYFRANVTYYGNQGFDHPAMEYYKPYNGYFYAMHTFMKAFYSGSLRSVFFELKENGSVIVSINEYGKITYKKGE